MFSKSFFSLYRSCIINLRAIQETNETMLSTNGTSSFKQSRKNLNRDDGVQSIFDLPVVVQIIIYILLVIVISAIISIILCLYNSYKKKELIKIENKDEKKEVKIKNDEMISPKKDKIHIHIDLNTLDYI